MNVLASRAVALASLGAFLSGAILALACAVGTERSGADARQHVAIHRTCPRAGRHTAKSHEPDADRLMVPTGAVSVLLCRYHGLNPMERYQRLDAAALVTRGSTVRALLRGINGSFLPPEGTYFCPRDDASKAVAFFRYSNGHEAAVVIGLAGCEPVSNGHLVREADWKTVERINHVTRS
jgi:hypothetical protein